MIPRTKLGNINKIVQRTYPIKIIITGSTNINTGFRVIQGISVKVEEQYVF